MKELKLYAALITLLLVVCVITNGIILVIQYHTKIDIINKLQEHADFFVQYIGTMPANRSSNDNVEKDISENEILSVYMAATYLKLETEELAELLNKGQFEGTYFIIEEEYYFIKEKLYNWCLQQTDP